MGVHTIDISGDEDAQMDCGFFAQLTNEDFKDEKLRKPEATSRSLGKANDDHRRRPESAPKLKALIRKTPRG